MSLAPFQLWIDGAPIASAVRTSGTVTITTQSAHGITTGSYVQLGGFTGTVGDSIPGVYQATATSSTAFTVVSAGTAGTAVTTSSLTTEFFSFDLMSPLDNYSAASRPSAIYIDLETLQMSASGDGEPSQLSFVAFQDVTGTTPWYLTIPDQSRIRLVKTTTGSVPAAGQTFFRGFIQKFESRINESGQGTITQITGLDVNALLDRVIIYGEVRF